MLKYAVDVPFWDEWEALRLDALSVVPNLKWIFAFHNEHRIAVTKFLTWIFYRIFDWNVAYGISINWFIFGFLLVTLLLLLKKISNPVKSGFVWFFPFLLSSIAIENHVWGFQSSFHFCLIFLFWAIMILFKGKSNLLTLLGGALLALLSAYSLASGLIGCVIVSVCFSVWKFNEYLKQKKNSNLFEIVFLNSIIFSGLALWFWGYISPKGHPPIAFPFQKAFISYYVNIVSLGFGVTHVSTLIGFVCFVWVIIPLYHQLRRVRSNNNSSDWMGIAVTMSILGILAVIALGRANFGVAQSKSSRYAEFSMMLVPIGISGWCIYLKNTPNLRRGFIVLSWVLLLVCFSNKWRPSNFRDIAQPRKEGLLCIKNYYEKRGDGICPTIYPASLKDKLEQAKKLRLSFYKGLFLEAPL